MAWPHFVNSLCVHEILSSWPFLSILWMKRQNRKTCILSYQGLRLLVIGRPRHPSPPPLCFPVLTPGFWRNNFFDILPNFQILSIPLVCIHVCDRCGPWSSVVTDRSALLAIVKNMTRDTNLTNLTNNIQIVTHLIMKSINLKEKIWQGTQILQT